MKRRLRTINWGVEWWQIATILLVAILCGLILVACGPPPPTQGTVVSTRHVPEEQHWHDTSYKVCLSHDKDGYCTWEQTVHDGHWHRHPERWEIQIEECKERKGPNCVRGWINFGEGEEARIEQSRFPIGVEYPNGRLAR